MSISIVAIQNPAAAEADILYNSALGLLTPAQVVNQYGSQIEQGAFVTLIDRDRNDIVSVQQFVADRIGDVVYLQDNSLMDDLDAPHVDNIGVVIASGEAALLVPAEELETYTVFGNNDDDENFVAVVTATDATVEEVGIQAGLVDKGYEGDVIIAAILRGDQSGLETVSI